MANNQQCGWLPIINEKEQSIVDYLEVQGVQQLVIIQIQESVSTAGSPVLSESIRKLSANLWDSEFMARRRERLSLDIN